MTTGNGDRELHAAELESLRQELARADQSLADSLAARVRLARWVQEFKRGAGLPVHDAEQERLVVERFAARAEGAGVPRELAERIARSVVEAGRLRDG